MVTKLFPALFLLCILSLAAPQAAYARNDVREVKIGVIVDEEDLAQENFEKIMSALKFANDELENNKDFRIKLHYTISGPWDYPKGKNELESEEAYPDITRISEEWRAVDIVVAYTSKKVFRREAEDVDGVPAIVRKAANGIAVPLSRAALVRIDKNMKIATLHEIYHLFGAQDIYDGTEESIMRGASTVTILDKQNYEIVKKNRLRSFSK